MERIRQSASTVGFGSPQLNKQQLPPHFGEEQRWSSTQLREALISENRASYKLGALAQQTYFSGTTLAHMLRSLPQGLLDVHMDWTRAACFYIA